MKKLSILKSALISALLVVMVMTIIPAVNAVTFYDTNDSSFFGEGVGAGGSANLSGGVYTNCVLHAGRWLGGAQSFGGSALHYTVYLNGSPSFSGSVYSTSYDYYPIGSYSSIGMSAGSNFVDSRHPYHIWGQAAYAVIP